MSVGTDVRPSIERADVSSVVVEEVCTPDRRRQHDALDALLAHWDRVAWQPGLCSLACFASTMNGSLLTYTQWHTDQALDDYRRRGDDVLRPRWATLGVPGEPRAYRLYRVARPVERQVPEPAVGCFPVATFPMADEATARGWVDALLDSEEQNEGTQRAYPGAIAANFHVAVDGRSVFLMSEWHTEAEAVAHIDAVIIPVLRHLGSGEDAGNRYRFHGGRSR